MYVGAQFSSVAQSCLTLCERKNCCTPGLPVHHQLPEFTQSHVHQVGDAIQPSHPLSPLLLLPPIPPSIRVFSNESALRMRPPPGALPDTGIDPAFPALAGGFFTTEPSLKSPSRETNSCIIPTKCDTWHSRMEFTHNIY